MMNILLTEDNRDTQLLVRSTLSFRDNVLTIVETAREALEALQTKDIHLMILDLSLPDQNGLQLYTQIQADLTSRNIPVIILTGTTDIHTKVAAFSMGVDDYILKPFDPMEFRARVEAKLKKIQLTKDRDEVILRKELQLNLSRQKAYILIGETPQDLDLTPLEFKILYQLARHEENVFTRNQLLNSVWGESTHVLDRTVDAHISMLRKKLGDYAHYIQAVLGEGYRFSTEVQVKAKSG